MRMRPSLNYPDLIKVIYDNSDSQPGETVFIEGAAPKQGYLSNINDKKFKKAIEHFRTNDELKATFSGIVLKTSLGDITVESLKNCRIS